MNQNRSFLSILLSQSLFQLGEALYVLAVVTLIYVKTESVLCATLLPFIRGIAALFSGVLAPLVMKRWPLRSLIIRAQTAQALTLLALLLYLDHYELHLPILSVFFVIIAFLQGWASPSRNAMIPRVVEEKDLIKANSTMSTVDQVSSLSGFMLGGMLVVQIGTIPSLWLAVALSACSGLLSLFIKDPVGTSSTTQKRHRWADLKETWSFVYRHPLYRRLFMLDSIEYIAASVWVGAITLAFVKDVLNKNEEWWGFLNGSYLLGTALGGICALTLSKWLEKKLKAAFIFGSLNLGILTIFFAMTTHPFVALILFLMMGIPYEVRDVALRTLLQSNASTTQLPTIFAAHHATLNISVVVGLGLMGALTEYYGPQTAYLASAILVLVSAALATTLPVGHKHEAGQKYTDAAVKAS